MRLKLWSFRTKRANLVELFKMVQGIDLHCPLWAVKTENPIRCCQGRKCTRSGDLYRLGIATLFANILV